MSIARMTQVGPTAPSGLLPSNRQAWQSSKLLCSVQRPSLNRDLPWAIRDNFRCAAIFRDFAGDADMLALVIALWSSELASILTPDQDRENLLRIRSSRLRNVGSPFADEAYRPPITLPHTVAVSPM